MNHGGLFYGRKKDIPGSLVRPSATGLEGESFHATSTTTSTVDALPSTCNGGGSPPATAAAAAWDTKDASEVRGDDAGQTLLNADDTTLLHGMLEDIMTAADAFKASPSSCTPGETLPACAYLLRRYFHLPSGTFKPSQQEVCFSILSGHNTLAVCPTGWGKSLCYQFPMLVHRLLFESRYEQWCRQTGVSSSLTRTNYAQGTEEGQEEPHRLATAAVAATLPPTIYSRFCIVVSPLLALMEDQAEKINSIDHLHAFVLSSRVDVAREAQLLNDLQSPLCPLDILFVSPERFIAHVALRRLLQAQRHRLAMLCVDEVHCVSGWAYDFRPTFMYVSRVLESPLLEDGSASVAAGVKATMHTDKSGRSSPSITPAPAVPYLCLTATATAAVVRDVKDSFHIQRTFLCADQRRDNLELQAVDLVKRHAAFHSTTPSVGSSTSASGGTRHQQPVQEGEQEAHEPSSRVVQDALLEAVRQLPKPMLVYVQSRADADELSGLLSTKLSVGGAGTGGKESTNHSSAGVFHAVRCADKDAGDDDNVGTSSPAITRSLVIRCYHAALTRSMRTATQRQFLDGKVDVLVATVAFGMGIDKANIRSVVHASAPSSLEGYVQEIGRAGRDGERSFCRILYNPFDFYALRSRLWTALLSPAEMRSIVQAVLSGPVTQVGQRLMLVSPSALSTELGFSVEAIETVLFLLLTQAGGKSKSSISSSSVKAPFHAVLGSYPLKYKVLSVNGEAEAGNGAASANGLTSGTARRRGKALSAAAAASAGIGLLLRQLGATDAVLELCRVLPNMPNQIEMANRLALSLADFQQRMQDLILGNTVTIARYGVPSALLVEVADTFADAASPAGQEALVEHLLALHRGRLDAQVRDLRVMFRLLASPSHDAIASTLRGESIDTQREASAAAPGQTAGQPWSPPGRGCGRLRAVSIANAFVEENRMRIHSSYDALRALMGIRPKSLIQHGKYAGQLPLEQSWYVSSPYFGALRSFELAWVLQILAPHKLDVPLTER